MAKQRKTQRTIDLGSVLAILMSLFLICPPPAHAYFDLTMANYAIQMFFGFGASMWFAMRGSLKSMRDKKIKPQPETEGDSASAEMVADDGSALNPSK